jgi:quinol monooxygenase YgiN
MEPYVVVAVLPAKPGGMEDLKDAVRGMLERALAEETGLLRYAVHETIEGDRLVHVEVYASEAAFEEHFGSGHVTALNARLADLLGGEVTLLKTLPVVLVPDARSTLV